MNIDVKNVSILWIPVDAKRFAESNKVKIHGPRDITNHNIIMRINILYITLLYSLLKLYRISINILYNIIMCNVHFIYIYTIEILNATIR